MTLTHKIGILPLARDTAGEVALLIHKPRPKDGESDVPWGLARGTRMVWDGAGGVWRDVTSRDDALAHAQALEPVYTTALREMEEELGLTSRDFVGPLQDMGVLEYASTEKGRYPIQWFSGWVADPTRPRRPRDADDTRWVTRPELAALADAGQFKTGYMPVVEHVLAGMGA